MLSTCDCIVHVQRFIKISSVWPFAEKLHRCSYRSLTRNLAVCKYFVPVYLVNVALQSRYTFALVWLSLVLLLRWLSPTTIFFPFIIIFCVLLLFVGIVREWVSDVDLCYCLLFNFDAILSVRFLFHSMLVHCAVWWFSKGKTAHCQCHSFFFLLILYDCCCVCWIKWAASHFFCYLFWFGCAVHVIGCADNSLN